MSNESQREDIRPYIGIGEKSFNHHPVYVGSYACVSPVVGIPKKRRGKDRMEPDHNDVSVPKGVLVRQDSGAFSWSTLQLGNVERNVASLRQVRPSFMEALKIQEQHAIDYGYVDQIEDRASFDVLIDETWSSDEMGQLTRKKKRWSETEADLAVQETVAAASYLDKHRNGIACVMSAQGVSPQQYLRCSQRIVKYMRDGDTFGLGGWCILGKGAILKEPPYLASFYETLEAVIPFLASSGVKKVHIWGVCFTRALGPLLQICDEYGLSVSTDSVGPTTRPTRGEWGYGSWRNPRYQRPDVFQSCKAMDGDEKAPDCLPDTQCRGLERARHVEATIEWMEHFRDREPHWYLSPGEALAQMRLSKYQQLGLFADMAV